MYEEQWLGSVAPTETLRRTGLFYYKRLYISGAGGPGGCPGDKGAWGSNYNVIMLEYIIEIIM